MTRRILIALALVALAAATAAVVLLTPAASPERVAAALILLLALPGAALDRLLRSERHRRDGSALLRAAGFSIAIVILDSAGLYLVGIALTLHAWAISVAVLTAALALGGVRAPAPARRGRAIRPLRVLQAAGTALLAAVAIAAGVLVSAQSVQHRQARDRFAQLWILPAPGGARSATIGIFNHDAQHQRYVMTVYVNGRVSRQRSITVARGQRWSSVQRFPRRARDVRVTLRPQDAPGPVYRSVRLRLA